MHCIDHYINVLLETGHVWRKTLKSSPKKIMIITNKINITNTIIIIIIMGMGWGEDWGDVWRPPEAERATIAFNPQTIVAIIIIIMIIIFIAIINIRFAQTQTEEKAEVLNCAMCVNTFSVIQPILRILHFICFLSFFVDWFSGIDIKQKLLEG